MFLKIKPFIDLCRVSNLPTVWTNVLTATLLATGSCCNRPFFILAISMSLFYSAGMCFNDVFDLAIDRIHRPNRPIPSGKVSRLQAAVLAVTLLAIAILLLFFVPCQKAIFPGITLAICILRYNARHKDSPTSIVLMAACRFLVFITTELALSGRITLPVLLAATIHFGYIVLISATARFENSRPQPFTFPVIPWMLAGISLLDGVLIAVLVSPWWMFAGGVGCVLTIAGQRFVRGD